MGNTATKFRKALVSGDEALAWQLYEGNPQFRDGLDPNASYGEQYQHNTPLHYVCRHAMTRLLRSFLFSKEGNPNKRNVHNETCLHVLCQGPQILLLPEGALSPRLARPQRDEQRRSDCLQMILSWTGARLESGQYEKANVNTTDNHHSTCLHYAAAAGMKSCVELLIQSEADLFVEDEDKLTPCDHAERHHHTDLALSLESQMVFSCASAQQSSRDAHGESRLMQYKEPYEGLKIQDLRRLKDMLIVETADMLQAPLFTAEALLRAHDWDREKLLEAWMSDAEGCCQRSGVTMPTPPPSGYNAWDTLPSPRTPRTPRSPLTLTLTSPTDSCLTPGEEGLATCGICLCSISVFEDPIDMSCGHEFCRCCWEGFLNVKIQEGDAHNIFCPAYECYQLVPVHVIESVVSREMDQRYLQFDIKAFVENNPSIRWCPAARCERAVRLTRPGPGDSDPHSFPLLPSPAVDCGKGHLFCWECLGEAHEPCDCQMWRNWLQKVTEMKPEELAGVSEAYEDAANCLWLLTNSKPCANCKSPIQKNEGCNHMQCAKCKYDFCWICLEEWKKHSSSTGGYYRCTRYEIIQQLEEQSKEMTVEAEKKHKSFQELDRFMHYYTRFKNHEHSYKLEQKLLKTAKEKMEQLSRALISREGTPPDTRFIEDGVTELLKTRRVLKCSYPYGFFLQHGSTQKEIFELMQTDLEMVVEDLAQKVNRPYLRTPRHKIISAARLVQQKRQEFLASVARGVAPNDSPDPPRRNYPGGSWDWEYLGFASPEMGSRHSVLGPGDHRERQSQDYADIQYRRRHRPRRRGDMLSLHNLRSSSNTPETSRRSDNTDPTERTEGRRRALGSLDEDDPNILLAIQLSLQDSRREQGLEGGTELEHDGGLERRPGPDLADASLHTLSMEDPPGARGSSFPTSLLDPPRPPNRTDSTSQPSILSSLPLPPPPPTLSAELLELGDSLMKLGNITTPHNMDTEPTCSHGALTAPSSDCSHRVDHNTSAQRVLDHISITDPHPDSKEQSYCSSSVYSAEGEHPPSCALDCTHNPLHASLYNRGHNTGDCSYQPGNSYTAEHPSTYALDQPPRPELQPPIQLCLPSPEPEPDLLLSPVIPPGAPFTPSDPQSLEALDPTASAQLLDNIMAWFNNNINPQNNPQNLALIPSPPTTETDSSPDTHTEAERDRTSAPVWQPLEGKPDAAEGRDTPKRSRPDSLELENRDVVEEGVSRGCVSDLSLDEVHTHPRSHSQHGDGLPHSGPATEGDADAVLQLEGGGSPAEWEEQEHLV
ncbi:ankyrin repeat and IBR domain-containing protein 1-like isoform X1 [Cyprinodon tularosa]|uniref:ankyrin repeat and IBR domain-containing protein 1-like isoform X1 n=1 Tax=Cyprinodon tularosa TaxID=77115 RepID=UPI0018E23E11|nr:ankyrin repeat and IBR domain-containing protein 1-like isoform X1 [Cyprinodon tularosa]XP_038159183.1 ankyrin repeat and IBR domain-containing protein 1-like isoform X1 [Cyprinodon tularosa]